MKNKSPAVFFRQATFCIILQLKLSLADLAEDIIQIVFLVFEILRTRLCRLCFNLCLRCSFSGFLFNRLYRAHGDGLHGLPDRLRLYARPRLFARLHGNRRGGHDRRLLHKLHRLRCESIILLRIKEIGVRFRLQGGILLLCLACLLYSLLSAALFRLLDLIQNTLPGLLCAVTALVCALPQAPAKAKIAPITNSVSRRPLFTCRSSKNSISISVSSGTPSAWLCETSVSSRPPAPSVANTGTAHTSISRTAAANAAIRHFIFIFIRTHSFRRVSAQNLHNNRNIVAYPRG